METELAAKEQAAETTARAKVTTFDHDFEEEKQRYWDVTCDMTRQYKSMQQEKDLRVSELQSEIQANLSTILNREQQFADILKEKEERLREKDDEVKELKKKIEEMSQEFSRMLKETLDQMQEKIEMVNRTWEEELVTPAAKKLEEINPIKQFN
jgi:hypothetical protein